ncbi:MAG: hypothetical protein QOF89_6218 [Acidobacteriota bacterium]|jgi:hypothetical protein|nr:hypothetical protein [Acidobacteriota bacterium]
MPKILVVLIALSVVVITTSSMRRQGRMTAATQWVLVGIIALVAVAIAVLTWLNRPGA